MTPDELDRLNKIAARPPVQRALFALRLVEHMDRSPTQDETSRRASRASLLRAAIRALWQEAGYIAPEPP